MSPSVEVKNKWSCTSTPPICFRGTNRDDLIFTACKVPHLLQPLNFTASVLFCYAVHEYGRLLSLIWSPTKPRSSSVLYTCSAQHAPQVGQQNTVKLQSWTIINSRRHLQMFCTHTTHPHAHRIDDTSIAVFLNLCETAAQ